MQSVILDVDGTLVNSYEVDADLFCRAVTEAIGPVEIRADWGDYVHVTDRGILDQILRDNGLSRDAGAHAGVRTRFGELLKAKFRVAPCGQIPGAGVMLAELREAPGLQIGIATGGWSNTAAAKLTSADLDVNGLPLASSDDHHARIEIMKSCAKRLDESGRPPVYIGDGEWDQKACAELGWAFVGIGPRLRGETEVWLENYVHCNMPEVVDRALSCAVAKRI